MLLTFSIPNSIQNNLKQNLIFHSTISKLICVVLKQRMASLNKLFHLRSASAISADFLQSLEVFLPRSKTFIYVGVLKRKLCSFYINIY